MKSKITTREVSKVSTMTAPFQTRSQALTKANSNPITANPRRNKTGNQIMRFISSSSCNFVR